MKLAFCLFNYFPFGGLQRDFMRIARVCRDRGHEIHVFAMEWEGDLEPHFHLHLLANKRLQNHTRSQLFVEQMALERQKENFDCVVGFNKMPGLDLYYAADVCFKARMRANKPFIVQWLPRYRTMIEMEKAVFAQGKKTEILLISAKQQPEYEKYYHTEPTRFHLLPPGIAKDRIAPSNAHEIRAEMRSIHGISPDHFMLLMVGSGFKTKGLDRSIRAMAALPEALKARCHLFVIGQDNPDKFLEMAKKYQIESHITFLGGRSDVANFLLAADLLLHPSYHENTGTAILEAIVAGLPVLTLDVCGYAGYVEKANAGRVLSAPFMQTQFNDALQNMLASDEQRRRFHQHGLAFAMQEDLYSLPEKAADLITAMGHQRELLSA